MSSSRSSMSNRFPHLPKTCDAPISDAGMRARLREALHDIGVAEVMAAPESRSIGSTLGELDLPSNYNVSVIAIRHRGQTVIENIAKQTLDFGDILLVGGNWERHREIERRSPEFPAPDYAGGIPRAVAGAATGTHRGGDSRRHGRGDGFRRPAHGQRGDHRGVGDDRRRLRPRWTAIYRVISWKALVVIAGMLPLATALTKTGATTLMAEDW